MALRDARKGGKLLVGFGVAGAVTAGLVWALRRAQAAESAAGKYKAAAAAAGARAAAAANAANAAAGREQAALATAEANARTADANARAAAQNASNAASARADAANARAAVGVAQSQVADARTAAQAAGAREALARAQAAAAQAQATANAREAAAAKQQADAAAAREASARAQTAAAKATLEKQQALAVAQEEQRQMEQAEIRVEKIEEPKPQVPPPPRTVPPLPPQIFTAKTAKTKTPAVTTVIDPAKLNLVGETWLSATNYNINEFKKRKGQTLTLRQANNNIAAAFSRGGQPSTAPWLMVPRADYSIADPNPYWALSLAQIRDSMKYALAYAKAETDYQTGALTVTDPRTGKTIDRKYLDRGTYQPMSGTFGEPAFRIC